MRARLLEAYRSCMVDLIITPFQTPGHLLGDLCSCRCLPAKKDKPIRMSITALACTGMYSRLLHNEQVKAYASPLETCDSSGCCEV